MMPRTRPTQPLVLILAVFLGVGAAGARQAASPLWHGLEPGPDQIGFEAQFILDDSRSFYPPELDPTATRSRTIRLFIGYPGKSDAAASRIRFGDYIDIHAPDAHFASFNDSLRRHDARSAGGRPNSTFRLQIIGPGKARFPDRTGR